VYKQIAGELPFPHDVYTTPGNSFWVLLASPHLTLALALTLLSLGLAWLGYKRRRFGLSLAASGAALFLGLGHIYDLVTVWAVLGAFGVLLTLRDGFRWHTLLSLAVVVVLSVPVPLYFGWVSSSANPMWQQALAQYDNLGAFTPSLPHLLVLLGLTFFLALGGFLTELSALSRQSDRGLFLKGWFVVNLVLIYLPLRFQVMLLTGFQFVLAVLATDFVFKSLIPWLKTRLAGGRGRWQAELGQERLTRWVPTLIVLAVLPTNLYLLAWRFVDLQRHNYPFYLYQDEVAAMRWLESNTDPDQVVLSAFSTGHYIPGLAGNRAFLSNAVMTLDFNHKRGLVDEFFESTTPDARRLQIVQKYDIEYVFFGPAERTLGGYNPAASSLLTQAFSTSVVSIYRVEDAVFQVSQPE
jgi:hypothetical protein